jgi:glutamine synthetase
LIASGLQGVEEKLSLKDAYAGNAYEADEVPRIPGALYKSLDHLEASSAFKSAFGDEVVEHYLHCGRWELSAFEGAVTDWEKFRLFERC